MTRTQPSPLERRGAPPALRGAVAAVPALLVLAVALVASAGRGWARLGVPVGPVSFLDLRQLTASSQCVREMPGWDWTSATCDPIGRPYNYPLAWAQIFAQLGVTQASTDAIGFLMIVLFALSVLGLGAVALGRTRRSGIRIAAGVAVLAAAALAPPARLALERGNIDVFVLALLVLAALLSLTRLAALFPPLLALLAFLKLYPIGAALALLVPGRSRRTAIWVYVLLTGAGLLSLVPQLRSISGGTPQTANDSYGASVIPLLLAESGAGWATGRTRAIGLALLVGSLVIAAVAALLLGRRDGGRLARFTAPLEEDRGAATLFLVGSGTFLVSYCVGTSFDYRLIVLLPAVAGLIRADHGRGGLTAAAAVLVLLTWLSYPIGGLQWIGDACWLVAVPVLAVVAARIALRQLDGVALPLPAAVRRLTTGRS